MSVVTWIPQSAPIASAVLIVSRDLWKNTLNQKFLFGYLLLGSNAQGDNLVELSVFLHTDGFLDGDLVEGVH